MTFVEKLGKEFVVTGEVEPPDGINQSFLEKARKYKGYADALNSTDSPMGQTQVSSLVSSYLIKEKLGMEPIIQMCARDRNKTAITNDLLGANLLGINNVLCLTGDYPKTGAKPVYELDAVLFAKHVSDMNRKYDNFDMKIGVGFNPMASPNEPEQIKLEKKLEYSDFVQTQPIFDLSLLENTVIEDNKDRIIVGVMPPSSRAMLEYFNKSVPGVSYPEEILGKVGSEDDGVQIANRLVKDIKKEGFAGVHLILFKLESRIGDIL